MLLILIICIIVYILYQLYFTYYVSYTPVKVIIQHHVIRIPMEDRVDLVIEDTHNVHNSCLKRGFLKIIKELQGSDQQHYTIDTSINAIYDLIRSNKTKPFQVLDNAARSLEQIDHLNAIYQAVNIYEKEVIRLVWERINHPINQNKINDLYDSIIEQLADCQTENNDIQCCEGRVMRVIQSLECLDTENIVNLRPMWAYKEEIANQIPLYRDKILNKLPPEYKQLYDKLDLTDKDKEFLNKFNQCLIKNLTRKFEKDYISKGLLTKEELHDITQVYYDSLYDY